MTSKNPKTEYKDESYFKPKECPKCKSTDIIKWGFRFNHTTKKRRYLCKKCNFTFTVDDGFWKTKKKREMITACLDLYMNGMSLRKVSSHTKQFSNDGTLPFNHKECSFLDLLSIHPLFPFSSPSELKLWRVKTFPRGF